MNRTKEPENGVEELALRRSYYDAHLKQAWEDIQTSSDDFDKNLLAVSSGALGVSLAFIKDIVPLDRAVWLSALYASWICFALCLVITIFSFRFAIAAQRKFIVFLREYYIDRKEEALNKKSWYSKAVTCCTYSASLAFLVGLVCTLAFCCVNVKRASSLRGVTPADLKSEQAIPKK
jgi:hypothetical protein